MEFRGFWSCISIILVTGVLLASAAPGFAEQASNQGIVRGRLVSSVSAAPLVGAEVSVEGTGLSDVTDEHGFFLIRTVPTRRVVLRITYLGKTYPDVVSVDAGLEDAEKLTIRLEVGRLPRTEHVVVTANRRLSSVDQIPAAVNVLTSEDLESLPASNLAETLSYLPGLYVYDIAGTDRDPGINGRGFTGGGENDYVLLLVDGVRVNDVGTGRIDWDEVPIEDIERVEVVRGPTTPLYGDAAVAGIVNVLTRQPSLPRLATDLEIGGFDHKRIGVRYGSGQGDWWHRTSFEVGSGAGYRSRSDWDQVAAMASFGRALRAGRWELSLRYNRDRHQNPGPLPEDLATDDPRVSLLPYDRVDRRRLTAAWTVDQRTGRWRLKGSAFLRHQDDASIDTVLIETNARSFRSISEGADFHLSTAFGKSGGHKLLIGAELTRSDFDSRYSAVDAGGHVSETVADGDGSRTAAALYLQTDLSVGERLNVVLGARADLFRDRFQELLQDPASSRTSRDSFAPKLGMAWRPSRVTTVFANVSRTFRVPTPAQLFDQRRFFGMSITNPDLKPQTGTNYEFGVRVGSDSKSSLGITAYTVELENEIGFDPRSFRLRNIGKTRHRGIEASYQSSVFERWMFRFSYAYTDAESRLKESRGAPLDNVPRHLASLALRWLHSRGSIGGTLRVSKDITLDPEGTVPLKDYAVLDLRIRQRVGRVSLAVTIQNALDERYAAWGFISPLDGSSLLYPGSGRRILGTISLGEIWSGR